MINQINRTFWKLFYLIGNLRLSIGLLLLIALVSSLGTLIEQDKVPVFYEINYPISKPIFGFIDSDKILLLGLDHIYTTNWFIFLLIMFGGSLCSCTLSRQLPSLKLARLWQFFKQEKNANKTGMSFKLDNVGLNKFSYLLRKKNYNVIQQGPYLYAYKGLVGKIGPILVHASIVFVLLGSIFGFLSGFVVQEIIPKGETFHLQNIIASGPMSYVPQDFQGYIKDFKITYNDQGIIDQFYSDVSILDNDLNVALQKTIFVNEPLRYKEATFYQTDWGIVKAEIILNKKKHDDIVLQEINVKNGSRLWVGPIKGKAFIILQDLTGRYSIYSFEKKLLGQSEIGHKIFINGDEIRMDKVQASTGLQIKSDPGINVVYFGFFVLIFSVILSYTSYFQIWAVKVGKKLSVYGNTNRAVYFFEKNILELLDILQREVSISDSKNLS